MNHILKFSAVFVLSLLCSAGCRPQTQKSLNLDFELAIYDKYWHTGGKGFIISLDSLEKHRGKFSLRMEMPGNPDGDFGVFTGMLPIETFSGKNVEFRGWIKTKDVKNGYAGLWLRVDGDQGKVLGFDNMHDRGLKGDNDWTQVSIKMDVSADAVSVFFGGLFPGEGTVWFDDLELYVEGKKITDVVEPEPKTSLSQQEIAALKKYIYPLRTYEPDGSDTKDLEVLDKLIGGSKVVALGEVSHGSSEIFKMKNRIIQYLAANNGFDIFSIEANMPESYKVSDYTVRGEGEPKELIAGMYFWTWRTEEVLDMVEWMRRYNQPDKKIDFTGFDMQFHPGAVNELLDAFKGNKEAEDRIAELKNKLDGIAAKQQQNPYGSVEVDESEMKEMDSILSFLQNSIETLSPPHDKEWLCQNILIVRQYLGMEGLDINWRDKCMADNFTWITEHNPDSRFIIWAHNTHIMKTTLNDITIPSYIVMGNHLAQRFGRDYTTFGFTFFDGSFTAWGSKGLTSYEAAQAVPGTLEYLLNQLDEPIFILDLKKIKSDKNKNTEWLSRQSGYRSVGSVGGLGYRGEFHKERNIADDFDYLIFIRTSTPSKVFSL